MNQESLSHKDVRASLARKVEGEFIPEAYWIIDNVLFPRKGTHSIGVARQFYGALWERLQTVRWLYPWDLGTEEANIPLNGALYLPEEWINDLLCRERVRIAGEIRFKIKVELALELIDEVRSWGLKNRLVLSDSAYADLYEFRQACRQRNVDYIVQVRGRIVTGWTDDPHPSEPSMKKGGKISSPRRYATDLSPPKVSDRFPKTFLT